MKNFANVRTNLETFVNYQIEKTEEVKGGGEIIILEDITMG
ncbi:MAG: hypothetical protein AAFZ15_19410 [Bacteroidota bacterium]